MKKILFLHGFYAIQVTSKERQTGLFHEITTRFLGKDKRTLYATRIDATPRISLNAFLMFLTKIIGKMFA